jgi:UDPglucose--hexose-1-phosphate uridylyltransferase
MQELRKDPIHGRWVIIASGRNDRPSDYHAAAHVSAGGSCPFCAGNEVHTPPEVLSYRSATSSADQPGWRVRVVTNKYPALRSDGDPSRSNDGLFEKMNAVGAHEVVIETPHHQTQLTDMDSTTLAEVLRAYADRVTALQQDRRFHYVLVFKNQGPEAGATLEHSHSQIIATPVVPKLVQEEIDGAHQHYKLRQRCVFCDIVEQEVASGERLIKETERFVALSPFAARFPFETWILPRQHAAHFEQQSDEDRLDLANLLGDTLRRINSSLDDPPYNLVIHTAPCNEHTAHDYYHWHIEIMPKLTQPAGFEWGSGFYINPMSPEAATDILRNKRPALRREPETQESPRGQ